MTAAAYGVLDAALETLRGCDSALTNGNFNHAPMVAEALCALGRPEAVMPWIARYRPRLLPRPAPGERIEPGAWRTALGQRERFADWCDFFEEALAEAEWREVLMLWAGRLAPGISAAATHGAIRLGHAARALGVGETPPRRRELGEALASWAASYAELPSSEAGVADLTPRDAIRQVFVVPPERRRSGNIAMALARLGEFPQFARSAARVRLDGDLAARLAELTDLFALICLANIRNAPTAIAFIHCVTSLTALGHIAPLVGEATARALLRYGWQAGCGIYACYGGAGVAAVDEADRDIGAAIDQAIENGDEHVIKFTEACLWRHRRTPSPAYAAAVAHVLSTLAPRR